jgi:hypothetical protein
MRTSVRKRKCRGMAGGNHCMQRVAQSANQVCQEFRVNVGLPVVPGARLIAETWPVRGNNLKVFAQPSCSGRISYRVEIELSAGSNKTVGPCPLRSQPSSTVLSSRLHVTCSVCISPRADKIRINHENSRLFVGNWRQGAAQPLSAWVENLALVRTLHGPNVGFGNDR